MFAIKKANGRFVQGNEQLIAETNYKKTHVKQ